MLRSLAEAGQKFHRQQIKEPFDEPPHAVFRMAEFPRPVPHHGFAHAKSPGMRQHRHEAVQLAVEPHFGKYFAAITFQPAIVVVQPHARQPTHQPVEGPRGKHFVPRIVPHFFPAADHVVSRGQHGKQFRNLGRIVLQIGVERDDSAPRAA